MNKEGITQDAAIQLFHREDGTTSIWDHPNFKSSIALPDDYRPITRVEQGLEMLKRMRLNPDQMTVLKVVADALCANENQIKRYMITKQTASLTSRHLRHLAKYGLVERHKCRLAFIEEDGKEVIRPPGPYTLGIGGFKLMSHIYSDTRFTSPDFWNQNSLAVQRHVAMNEIRCMVTETDNARGWVWRPAVGGLTRYNKPFAAMLMATDRGNLQIIIDRAQMAQNFVGYFKDRLHEMRMLYERDGRLQIDGFPNSELQQIFMLSVSSVSMAKFMHEQLRLHTFPFDIWFVIDEWFSDSTGLEGAFAHATKDGLKRKRISVFRKRIKPNL